MITIDQLARFAGREPNENMRSVLAGLLLRGPAAGLNRPHRVAHYLAQLGHESGLFRFDREVWGPSAAQLRYEGRKDLGNTQPGDGRRFSGRTGMQATGRANYREVTGWARAFDPSSPDFEADPDAMLRDPWEGIVPLWFWETRGLNAYADRNHIETITLRINGGKNGLADRIALYARAALVLLGYGPTEVRRFQQDAGLTVDGDAGPLTRDAMHGRLAAATFAPVAVPVPAPPDVSIEADRLRAIIARAQAELAKASGA